MNPLSLLLGGIGGLFQTGYGLYQTLHGNSKLNKLQRPEYQIDPGIQYNQQLAAQNASQGLGDQSIQIATEGSERGLGSTINAGLQTGQGLGFANQAYQSQNDSFRELMAFDAAQKQKNQQIFMSANKDLRDENLRAFDYNKNIPYQQAYSKYTQQTNAGPQNIFGGLNQIGSMFTPFGGQQKTSGGAGYGSTVPGSNQYSLSNDFGTANPFGTQNPTANPQIQQLLSNPQFLQMLMQSLGGLQ